MNNQPSNFVFFLIGGALLSATAGFVDASTILAPGQLAVSHVTGSVAKLAVDTASGGSLSTGLIFGGIGAFFLGSALSGAALESTQLRLGRRYGVLLSIEGLLLTAAALLLISGEAKGVILAAAACGLQNAMATQYSGAIVRTTHVTGLVTDLGITLGKWVSRKPVESWRAILHTTLALSFGLGAFTGAKLYATYGGAILFGPAITILLLGAAYAARKK